MMRNFKSFRFSGLFSCWVCGLTLHSVCFYELLVKYSNSTKDNDGLSLYANRLAVNLRRNLLAAAPLDSWMCFPSFYVRSARLKETSASQKTFLKISAWWFRRWVIRRALLYNRKQPFGFKFFILRSTGSPLSNNFSVWCRDSSASTNLRYLNSMAEKKTTARYFKSLEGYRAERAPQIYIFRLRGDMKWWNWTEPNNSQRWHQRNFLIMPTCAFYLIQQTQLQSSSRLINKSLTFLEPLLSIWIIFIETRLTTSA